MIQNKKKYNIKLLLIAIPLLLNGCTSTLIKTPDPPPPEVIVDNSNCLEFEPSKSTSFNINIRNCTEPQLITLNISGYSNNTLLVVNTNGNAEAVAADTRLLPEIIQIPEYAYQEIDVTTPHLKPDIIEGRPFKGPNPALSKIAPTLFDILEAPTTQNFNVFYGPLMRDIRSLTATKVAENTRVIIYVESDYLNTGIYNISSRSQIGGAWNAGLGTTLATAFENSIYPKAQTSIGSAADPDGNGKVIILFNNIEYPTTDFSGITGIIAGYFYSPDLGGSPFLELNSNTDILYMNLLSVNKNGTASTVLDLLTLHTMAHEYQHLVNYSRRRLTSPQKQDQDTWLNESCAELFSDYAMGTLVHQISNLRFSNTIKNGLGLFYWQSSALQYTIGYNFLSYATLKTPDKTKAQILNELLSEPNGDYKALKSVFIDGNKNFANFKDLYVKFHLATLINQSSGIYGFSPETSTFNYSSILKTTATNLSLYPGGRIFKDTTSQKITNFNITNYTPEHLIYVKIMP